MTRFRFITAMVVVLSSLQIAGTARALVLFQPVIDEFWIVKDGREIFRDSFADGNLPPSGPDGATTYSVFGAGGMTSEVGGRLTMTPSLGDPTVITAGFADKFTGGLRVASTVPANPNFLGLSSSFEIHGLFDMANLPQAVGQSFGIRANDRALNLGNLGNDTIHLNVVKSNVTGDISVRIAELDFALDTVDVVDSVSIQSLVGSATQIELIISKAADSDAIGAFYILYDGTNTVIGGQSLSTFSTTKNDVVRIYDGEDYTRAQFFSNSLVPIPEPRSLALLGLGLLMLGRARLRLLRRS